MQNLDFMGIFPNPEFSGIFCPNKGKVGIFIFVFRGCSWWIYSFLIWIFSFLVNQWILGWNFSFSVRNPRGILLFFEDFKHFCGFF